LIFFFISVRRPTAAITTTTADSKATSETIGTSAGMLAMAEMLAAEGTPAIAALQATFSSSRPQMLSFLKFKS
jgi:hypothetical protein